MALWDHCGEEIALANDIDHAGEIDRRRHRVMVAGKVRSLTSTHWEIFMLLYRHRGDVVSSDCIRAELSEGSDQPSIWDRPRWSRASRHMEPITQQCVSCASDPIGGGAMRTTEVHLPDENDLAGRLTDMRIWLDKHRYEPSTFTYFFLDPGMKIRVAFKLAAEAEAFAQEFRGVLLDTPLASDQLITV